MNMEAPINKSRELLFSAMMEDEEMRAGKDRTLFQKERREDAETIRVTELGIACEHTPKPDLFG